MLRVGWCSIRDPWGHLCYAIAGQYKRVATLTNMHQSNSFILRPHGTTIAEHRALRASTPYHQNLIYNKGTLNNGGLDFVTAFWPVSMVAPTKLDFQIVWVPSRCRCLALFTVRMA